MLEYSVYIETLKYTIYIYGLNVGRHIEALKHTSTHKYMLVNEEKCIQGVDDSKGKQNI